MISLGWTRSRARQAGFTLLELMIVIAILGMLAFVATPPLLRYLDVAKNDSVKVQLQGLGVALDLYAYETGHYPSNHDGLESLVHRPSGATRWNGPYLKQAEMLKDPWGHPYHYRMPGRHGSYDLYSGGPDGGDPGENAAHDLRNW